MDPIWTACAVTVFSEGLLLFLLGFRSKREIMVVVCTNVLTNLSLNLVNSLVPILFGYILYEEALVVIIEFLIYRSFFPEKKGLFVMTLAANILSYSLGLIAQVSYLNL